MESGFSSPRADTFPVCLRVLVVDDDLIWLKILEKMLKKCSYEVTTCCLARDALELLCERKDGFDIVISDVNMPDMDGFKLLEHVGLEMDLPVIMMSVDGETSRVMKGVQHGACDYLLKPIRLEKLKNIWQHVLRKKIHEVRDIENLEGIDDVRMMRNGLDQYDDRHLLSGSSGKKRKDVENKHDDKDFGDPSAKKPRVVWTVELHQKFVKAVNQIGFDKVGPKKILDLMNVPWLTRENVASHLQKYRLYLSRLQEDNDLQDAFSGINHSDLSLKEPAGSLGLQVSNRLQQNNGASSNYGFSVDKILVHNVDPKINEGVVNCVGSLPMMEPHKVLIGDIPDPQTSSGSWLESGSSSPRADTFPVGLRVLVVDDDPTWLKILEKMLNKCSYEVTTCCLARGALELLRERKDGIDIVISDVNMPDIDGFELLEHVGLEMDLPVILMSVDGETSRVMKGVQHGACDYLLKPIRLKELKNIWQHVPRNKIHEVRDIQSHQGIDDVWMMRNGLDQYDDSGGDPTSGKKRKDVENKHDGKVFGDPSAKKPINEWKEWKKERMLRSKL